MFSSCLLGDFCWFVALSLVIAFCIIGYWGAPFWIWSIAIFMTVAMMGCFSLWILLGVALLLGVLNWKPTRRFLLSAPLLKVMKGLMPKISKTERAALEAGNVWIEGALFSGHPDFSQLLKEPYAQLTAEEKAFIAGPVTELCKMIDDWKIYQTRQIPDEVWSFIKQHKFMGMIIPRKYGGLEFSAMAHSEVIQMLASRSLTVAISVMVPNSLGPAELLTHYGTEEQKKRLLPRLAEGLEIPCFALTEPTAGSDAGSIKSEGILFKDRDDKIMIRLTIEKRYITLASVATLVGLAFKLKDPENILGKGADIGITTALIPATTPGLMLGLRHDPMTIPFHNCPIKGENVVISLDDIIGGVDKAGEGWGMLMQCLAAGRGISLPAQSVGGTKLVTRVASAHAIIRKQFGVAIGTMEGIREPLARIAAYNYLLEAARRLTCGAIDKGMKPPVVTAIMKYNATEISRKVITDGMDILGGNALSMGPRNLLANALMASPIGITVEGANILTRTMIIFGQAAMIAHPYTFKEIDAIEKNDVKSFDEAFWGHVGHVTRNFFRSFLLSITRGGWAPGYVDKHVVSYFRKLSWASASFAIMSDVAMMVLGGKLKQKEQITGRFADILSWMYLGFSVLKRYEAEGKRQEDLPYVHYSMNLAFTEIQKGFDGLFENLRVPGLTWLFWGPLRWWSGLNRFSYQPGDFLTYKIARSIQDDLALRERMTEGIYLPEDPTSALGRLETTLRSIHVSSEALNRVRKAIRSRVLSKGKIFDRLHEAVQRNVITQTEFDQIKRSEELRHDAIQVDSFTEEQFLARNVDVTMVNQL